MWVLKFWPILRWLWMVFSQLHCFIETCFICSSMMEAHKWQKPFMKVGSGNVFSLSCQLFYLWDYEKYVCFSKWKNLLYKYIDLTVEAYEENSETSFFGKRVLRSLISNVHCTTDQNWMVVDVITLFMMTDCGWHRLWIVADSSSGMIVDYIVHDGGCKW